MCPTHIFSFRIQSLIYLVFVVEESAVAEAGEFPNCCLRELLAWR